MAPITLLEKPASKSKTTSGMIITRIHCPKCGSDQHSLAILETTFLETTCCCCTYQLMWTIDLSPTFERRSSSPSMIRREMQS
jgi:hypothetical protein